MNMKKRFIEGDKMEIRYGLIVKKKNKIVDIEEDLMGLKELDNITRQYCGKKELIDFLKSQGKLPKNINGSWTIKLVRGKNRTNCKVNPLYEEKYAARNAEPVFNQIMDFAKLIYDLYKENAKKVVSEEDEDNIYYQIPDDEAVKENIYNSMKKIKGLRNPSFYTFSRDYFLKNIYMINKNGERIMLKFKGIAEYDKQCNIEKQTMVNEKLLINFYNELLWGFSKIFCTESSRGIEFNYLNVRKYYAKYYNEFIKSLAKQQQEEKSKIGKQMKLKDFIPEQFENIQKPRTNSQTKAYTTWEEDESYDSIIADECVKAK